TSPWSPSSKNASTATRVGSGRSNGSGRSRGAAVCLGAGPPGAGAGQPELGGGELVVAQPPAPGPPHWHLVEGGQVEQEPPQQGVPDREVGLPAVGQVLGHAAPSSSSRQAARGGGQAG